VTADSTDDSKSSSKNNSNHSSDQHGAAADMQSQFDQVSQQQQLQHKVGISVDASHFFLTHLTSLVVFFASASI
jgi:alpha/beta superfamily hydrolase